MRNLSLSDAVLNPLQANSSEFPVFANKDYVKAQIKNAWAAVGVGDPDFDTEEIPEILEICEGTVTTQLSAGSEIGQVTWHKDNPNNPAIGSTPNNDNISASNGTLTIASADEAQNGDYFVKVTYNNVPGVGTCERSKKVAISVSHMVINQGEDEELCIGDDFTLTLSNADDLDLTTIEWETPPGLTIGTHYSINSTTRELTILNATENFFLSHEGTYTVTAECNIGGTSVPVSDEINITITDRPDGKLFYMKGETEMEVGGEPLAICTGEEITLAASGGTRYKWFEGTSNTPIEEHSNSITLIPTESTTYRVEIFNDCNNFVDLSVTVNILGGNNTIGLGGTQDICRHETFLAPDGYDSYTWTGDFGESNGQDIVIDEEPGTYDYTLTATIIEGEKVCTARETIRFAVFDFNENDVPDVDLLGSAECFPSNEPNSLTLTDKGDTKYAHWEWRLQGNPNPISEGEDSVEDMTSINEPGTYTLMVVRQEGGCELEVTHEVTYADLGVLGDMDITPNDPFGDYWKPSDLRQDNVITVAGTITVQSGASLVIQKGTIVEFIGENSGIVVERGGRLEAKNADFNLSDCSNSGDFWKGIEVFADPTAAHPTDYRLNGSNNHGVAILRNGRIENAETGISSGTSTDGVETVEGGAIVDVNGVTFENNLRGVYFGSARNSNEESKVKNCHFLHSAPFPNQSVDNPYQQVVLHALELPVLIEANTFEASANVNGIAARGTGIRVEDAAYMIGHATCTALGNDFVGVFQGIEVYSINTAHEAVSTVNNSFEEVDKGITFSSSAGDIVQFNTFELPIPELANDDSYAILTNGSMGLTIEENTINSGLPGANNIEGIVVRNSNIGGVDGVSLNNNSITGSLEVGTQFEGNNQNINLDCNSYSGFMMDWYIDWEAEIGESQNGAVQVGECDNFAPELALRNIWNDSNQTIFHLFNNSNQAVNLNVAQQYQPSLALLDGLIDPTAVGCVEVIVDNCDPNITPNCNFILGHNNVVVAHPIDPTQLTTPISPVEIIHGKSITDPLAGQPFLGLRKLQAAFWQMMAGSCDRACAIQLLTAQDEEWSKRLLVATYLNKKETTTANNLLATLPSHHAQALQYHNLMDLLLNYPLDANTESNLLSLAANAHDDYIQTLAESALSIYFGHQFIRSANPIDLNGHNKKAPTESSLLPVLQLQPNPATNQIDISIQNRAVFSSDLTISIYDTNGTHWRTISMAENQTQLYLDVTDLPMGMYFCRLYSEEGNFGMRKLMITK
ncbi:MAG: T9SS type A sorting domain-containing protein [Chitinophagales bacterium]